MEPVAPRCPDMVDIQNVGAMTGGERLACFGDASIELEGTIGCHGCTIHIFGEYKPSWLSNPNAVDDLLLDVPMDGTSLMLRFPPTVAGESRVGRSSGCGATSMTPARLDVRWPWPIRGRMRSLPPGLRRGCRLLCRQEFVVERYDLLGTDPRSG